MNKGIERFSLTGKVAIVIGGTRGIGEGIASGLSEAGAKVVVSSRKQEECDVAAKRIADFSGNDVVGISCDITIQDSLNCLLDKTLTHFGRVDILVNSAGINVRKDSIEFTREDWDRVQDVQLKGYFFSCQTIGKYMIENNVKGKIINISSIDSKVVSRDNIVSYMAAKGAISQVTKSLAVEWAKFGICVNAIAPGYFETIMTKPLFEDKKVKDELFDNIPQRRFGKPYADLSGLAIYLSSEVSTYTTGQTIYVDGGYTLV